MTLVLSEVYSRVMQFAGERGGRGTAFVCDVAGRPLLITAKHLCIENREEQATIQHPWTNGGEPLSLIVTRVGDLHAAADVAAFECPARLRRAIAGSVELSAQGLVYSQDAFILGYPYGLSFSTGVDGQRLPLVKRGIVSGSLVDDEVRMHLMDTIANPGFSGGPMAFKAPGEDVWKIAGVVRGNVTGPATEATEADPNPPRMTAGLSYVTDAANVTALTG